MADRTHSHDTSTPAMGDETVPSEEFVLNAMAKELLAHAEFGFTNGANKAGAYEAAKAVWAVALSASHLAKEGGEAGAVDWLWWGRDEADKEHVSFGRWQQHPCQHRYKLAVIQPTEHDHPAASPSGCDAEAQHLSKKLDHHFNLRVKAEDDLKAERKAHDRTRVALEYANTRISVMQTTEYDLPHPSSALAKGSDAVREAVEEARSLLKVEYYDDGRIAAVGHDSDGLRKMVALLDAALSTPTEGPASQTEGMGEEAAADGSQAPLSDGRHRHLSRITEIVRGADSRMEAEQIALGYLRGAMSNEERAERAARDWAVAKWHEEVANRPLQNTHRRSLDTTWRQVIRYFGGDDERICGPRHDDLVATHDGMDFATPGTQVKPLEWQRFDNARTVTYRAMCPLGGIYYITSANEDPSFDGWKSHLGEFASLEAAKAAQQAEHEAKVRGCLARAALTPPETAEAVFARRFGASIDEAAIEELREEIIVALWGVNAKGESSVDPDDFDEKVSDLLTTAIRLLSGKTLTTPPETAEAVPAASDPAPATDDRERLVEALRTIAEGNLGDAPWQVNYKRIKAVARAALATEAGHG